MPTVSRLFVAAAFLLLAGGASGAPAKAPPRQTTITVMTRNLYLGANLLDGDDVFVFEHGLWRLRESKPAILGSVWLWERREEFFPLLREGGG